MPGRPSPAPTGVRCRHHTAGTHSTLKNLALTLPDQGYLKVSFVGPFYGSCVVLALDHEGYQYSLVCGPGKSYLWILARRPKLDKVVLDGLIAMAAMAGFDTSKLIFVDHG